MLQSNLGTNRWSSLKLLMTHTHLKDLKKQFLRDLFKAVGVELLSASCVRSGVGMMSSVWGSVFIIVQPVCYCSSKTRSLFAVKQSPSSFFFFFHLAPIYLTLRGKELLIHNLQKIFLLLTLSLVKRLKSCERGRILFVRQLGTILKSLIKRIQWTSYDQSRIRTPFPNTTGRPRPSIWTGEVILWLRVP